VQTVGHPRGEMSVEDLKIAEPDPVVGDHGDANEMSADALADTIDAIDSIPTIGDPHPTTFSV